MRKKLFDDNTSANLLDPTKYRGMGRPRKKDYSTRSECLRNCQKYLNTYLNNYLDNIKFGIKLKKYV